MPSGPDATGTGTPLPTAAAVGGHCQPAQARARRRAARHRRRTAGGGVPRGSQAPPAAGGAGNRREARGRGARSATGRWLPMRRGRPRCAATSSPRFGCATPRSSFAAWTGRTCSGRSPPLTTAHRSSASSPRCCAPWTGAAPSSTRSRARRRKRSRSGCAAPWTSAPPPTMRRPCSARPASTPR